MSRILFKRKFIAAIASGEKTTTLRRWKSRRVKAGTRAFVPGFGWLSILSCDRIHLKDLTEADARADGFPSLKALLATLAQIYPNRATDGRHWFRVVFRPETPKTSPAGDAKTRLVWHIRAELDKAVQQSGSLFPV